MQAVQLVHVFCSSFLFICKHSTMMYCTWYETGQQGVRIMWYDVCTCKQMTPFCHEVASVFVCGRAGPWWRYRGPSTEEIRLRHPLDACPPAATRERSYQHRSPNFPAVYHSYPHSLCNHGLLPITNTLHHDNLIMKLRKKGKYES